MRRVVRSALLIAAAVAGVVGVSGCSKKPTPESVSTMPDTSSAASDTSSTVTYGAFTDERDGKKYRTMVIGGKRWMAQNLNYMAKSGSWCYNDSLSYCNKYGRLYTWNTALTACPAGYHLPSRGEWDDLIATAGGEEVAGKRLKAESGWDDNGNGTDDYGFSILPGGLRYGEEVTGNPYSDSRFDDVGNYSTWWTATVGNDYLAYYRRIYYYDNGAGEGCFYKSNGYSVRCVADAP